ncbi:MAG TPA: hypothetical protein VFT45_02185 [Longimicrobium sp.]|nr:hypothetical protein [Longimicrobium sp.]
MKKTFLLGALILTISGCRAMAQNDPAMAEPSVSPACALAVAAALADLRSWYAESHAGPPAGFEAYVQQRYGVVACGGIEGRRITVALRPSSGRGGDVWYAIDADSFEIVERVLGR